MLLKKVNRVLKTRGESFTKGVNGGEVMFTFPFQIDTRLILYRVDKYINLRVHL